MPHAPEIRIDTPGSFARAVFHERHPVLIGQVLDALPYGPEQRVALGELLAGSTGGGVLEPPDADGPDGERWREWGAGLWGRRWDEAPFLWAESRFYRLLLEATGYFRPGGAWRGVDPFAPFKAAELAGAAVDGELAALDAGPDPDALLAAALWGNRADLSFRLTAQEDGGAPGLVADDSARLWAALERGRGGRVGLIADNAGRELLPDLVLIDHLLTSGLAGQAVLYVKPHPYFVSDATTADTLAALTRLRTAPGRAAAAVGERLWRAMGDGTLAVRTHPFFCAPLPYDAMPADLRADLAGATLTVLKGDLNYRRLVGDRHWPPTTPFAALTASFPTPVAALRTLKSDVAVGLAPDTVTRLDATGTPWRTSGRHALIQVRAQRPAPRPERA
ncbi:protein-glutamate O-methyltransferase family protein [Kitasatospora sp. NA04385]|uniref:damage-control phosphatase ARMT1 family protein n=1 Tax=Kitasatospora sp. NA04385 TaxID=2742135 RepID=UPI0015922B44|nr:damage-control phosphatase ARMT1 family protein [Kitasatospora sp. NA04385]QKW18418.1 protein-glutamate O-methyltransferase family protein [Kitasatospora sp. NA04385]